MCWSLLMLIVFLAPASDLPEGPEMPLFDKFVHVGIFVVFSFLLFNARMQHKEIETIRFPLIIGLLLCTMLFGIVIELAQSFMGLGREGDIYDLISDLVGYFLGLFFVLIYRKLTH